MMIKFPSIANNQIGYALFTGSDAPYVSRKPDFWVSRHLYVFDTYGDGLTQHAPEYMATSQHFEDVCFSLACYIQEHFAEFDLKTCNDIAWCFTEIPADKLKFLAGLKYDAEKRRYFTMQDGCKVSASEKFRHDKRYTEVPEWANGSRKIVPQLYYLAHDFNDAGLWQRAQMFADCWADAWADGTHMHDLAPGMENCSDDAYACLKTALAMVGARYQLSRSIDCATNNIGLRKPAVEAVAEPVAA